MRRNNIKTKVIGSVMAALCVFSAGAAISAVSASAAQITTASTAANTGRACVASFSGGTSYGYDWDYRANNTAAKISCTYNFTTRKYTFKATGRFAGVTDTVLKYATPDGKWHNVPIRFTTDSRLNVTGKMTGREYITNDRYTG